MFAGGKLVLLVASAGLILSGCQSPAKSTSSPDAPSASAAPQAPQAPESSPPDPQETTSRDIAVPAAVKSGSNMVAELAPTKTRSFKLVGVTWDKFDNDEHVTVEVRVRKDDGWTAWEPLEVDEDGGEAKRGGTEPWWTDSADQVSARVTTASGATPTGVKVVTVDPAAGDTPAGTVAPAFYSTSQQSSVIAAADGTPGFTPQPPIIMRTSWGAKAPIGCGEDGYNVYGTTTLGVNLHHTAGSNSYSKSQSASIVRGIQTFHQNGRGWCDIAYNFLVDKYGQIFEGRAGGINRPVRGSDSGLNSVNELTMGVSLMGNLDKVQPSTAMKDATVKLVGWRVGTFYLIPVKGGLNIGGVWLQRISGHRNVVSTACPGKYGYAWLNAKGGLRDRVSNYVSQYRSAIKSAAWRLDGLKQTVTGPVEAGEVGSATWRQTAFTKYDFFWRSSFATAYYVTGTARAKHRQFGGQGAYAGKLGFPTQNMTATSTPGFSVQKFERGAIYQVDAFSYALWDDIYKTYNTGANAANLGKPTSSIVESGSDKTATFDNGTITQTGTNPPVVKLTGAPAKEAPPTEPTPSPAPSPSAGDVGAESADVTGTAAAFPVLWLRRSGMISA
ncbi:hypothetical protein GCM10022234_25630 [Aeromicrobium panaciterrae]|uniref:N-acetylmuramoyl-L-alanine amidase n=1 Tax=Aeromicrobium panaciterrae TaxID=363861 RepID=UPI0031D8AFBE